MLTALAATAAFHPFGGGFPWILAIIVPLFWIGVIVLVAVLAGRRWRRFGGPDGPWAIAHGPRSAESTLADRYARGEIDEQEYRARLEVLRASASPPR